MIDRTGGNGGGAGNGRAKGGFGDLVGQGKPRGGETVEGTRRSEVLRGGNGADSIAGRGGNDLVFGGGGDDTLSGGQGNDLLFGGSGNDRIRTGEGRDTVFAGRGDDRVTVKGSAYVDGGSGRDTVTLKGAATDYTKGRGFFGTQVYTSNAGDTVLLRNVETVRFSEPVAPPPPPPPAGAGQRLAPNDAGAERIIVGPDSVRILGPETDFTFTGITDGRPADGPLTATAGSGTINGVETTAVPLGLSDPFDPGSAEVVFSLGSGFNPTGTVDVDAAFANGVRLDTTILREGGPTAPPDPEPPAPPPSVEGQPLSANDAGADTIFIGTDSIRLTGPDTDITFTGITDGGQFGRITAREAKGTVNGELVKAVPIDGAALSIGPGGITGIRSVTATFDNGIQLDSTIPFGAPKPPEQDRGLPLEANSLGAERIVVGPDSVRLLGPGTDFTFTGIEDSRPSDGPLTATAGSGTINGVETTAVSLGLSNPFDPGVSDVVFSLGSGFNATRTQGVSAAFATGDRLETRVSRD